MNPPILCEGVSRHFRHIAAIDNLNLQVPEESIYALLGPNGAGKTTLIKMLANILQPTSGRALVLGSDSRRLGPTDFAQIGYVSENQQLPDWMTVDYFFAYLKPFYPAWDDALAQDLRREFQLPGDRRLARLSRGMKMKVALASSLAYHPRLVLLDEPFSGLDPLVRDEFIQGLIDRSAGTTFFISSHDLAEIESFASHIGFLDAGRMSSSEEASALTERFREIEITLPAPSIPSNWPTTWLAPQSSASLIRFVETRFDVDQTRSTIAELFPSATNVSVNAMSLREIFVALARSQRRSAA